MNKTITIKDRTIFDKTIEEFLSPDYVYFPYEDEDKLIAKIGSNVTKEEPLLEHKGKIVYSSVSGKLLGTTNSLDVNNKTAKCLVVENDFKETVKNKKGAVKYINEYSKKEFLSLINKYGVYNSSIDIDAKTILVNGIDKDAYENNYSALINNNCTKILETIDAIANILSIDNTIFVVNNHDNSNVINLTNHIGTYPNIKLKLLADAYPNGYKEIVINNCLNKKQQTDGFIYFTVEDIMNIYTILKRVKPITEKIVTLSGNCIEKSKTVNIKIGTNIAEIVSNCAEITEEGYFVIVNGLIAGKTLDKLDQPITNDIKSIFLNTKDEVKEQACINCGLCNSKCPVNLNPKYLLEHKKADRSKCINCGLCTYICPAKINFKPHLGGKNE